MNALFNKLNLKEEKEIFVINHPKSFETVLSDKSEDIKIIFNLRENKSIQFAIFFVTKKNEIDKLAEKIKSKMDGDAKIWFAYPKVSSKNYKCNFNRDTGWESLGKIGLEGVRMVAIDEDWSALRFRRVEYIKKMTRRKAFALTDKGKQKSRSKK